MKKHVITGPLRLSKKTISSFHPIHFTGKIKGQAGSDHSFQCPETDPNPEPVVYETQKHLDSGCCCSGEASGCMTRMMNY
jgi:hypothetical protein